MNNIEAIIDQYIAEQRSEQDQDRHHDKFRVSDAGRCHLMRFWKRQGKPFTDQPDERTRRVFEVGHVFHRWIQDILQKKGLLIAKELEVKDEHRIGHVDAIVRYADDWLVMYDFKTVHSRKFHWKKKEGGNGDLHYAMQAWTYYQMCNLDIHEVRIAYISKDDLCIDEILVSDYDSIGSKTREDWEMLITAWEKGEEPKPNPMDWECKYCVYRSICKKEDKIDENL